VDGANLFGMGKEALAALVAERGEPAFRARQLYGWLYNRRVRAFDAMANLPKALRVALAEAFDLRWPEVAERALSFDGTRKYLFRLEDGATIEAVYIPEDARRTICISTQAGCPLKCAFCLTGIAGYTRNLKAGEILGQVATVMEEHPATATHPHRRGEDPFSWNIVVMGMGEPLLNYEQVSRALAIILSDWGLSFSWRHVTVSTAGIPEGIARLGRDVLVNLAVSLNAPDDPTRDRIMPVNRKYPLDVLMAALRAYPLKRGRRITLEYVLLKGINDTDDHARALVGLVNGIPVKINLIPFNAFTDAPFLRPDDSRVLAFQEILIYAHLNAIIRKSKGGEIAAACGQLAAGCTAGRPKLSRTKKRGRSDGAA
jgi:23S rRNA (adenine2503-C2)-methyltransferase